MKRKRLNHLLVKDKADICFLQERRIQLLDENIVRSLWGGHKVGWTGKNSEGYSGGLLILWQDGVIQPKFSFKGEGLMGFNAVWQGTLYNFINVYSSCSQGLKRQLWEKLLYFKSVLEPCEWIIGRDFNCIRSLEERKGKNRVYNSKDMEEFNDFIEGIKSGDVPAAGNKFSWSILDGLSKSKIDRILLTEDICERWKVKNQLIGNKVQYGSKQILSTGAQNHS